MTLHGLLADMLCWHVWLQDALGRSALMFAAGNSARDTLLALLDAGAWLPAATALAATRG